MRRWLNTPIGWFLRRNYYATRGDVVFWAALIVGSVAAIALDVLR